MIPYRIPKQMYSGKENEEQGLNYHAEWNEATWKKPIARGVDTCYYYSSTLHTQTPTAILQEADGKWSGYLL